VGRLADHLLSPEESGVQHGGGHLPLEQGGTGREPLQGPGRLTLPLKDGVDDRERWADQLHPMVRLAGGGFPGDVLHDVNLPGVPAYQACLSGTSSFAGRSGPQDHVRDASLLNDPLLRTRKPTSQTPFEWLALQVPRDSQKKNPAEAGRDFLDTPADAGKFDDLGHPSKSRDGYSVMRITRSVNIINRKIYGLWADHHDGSKLPEAASIYTTIIPIGEAHLILEHIDPSHDRLA
jgi:hypothetical protein